ncbi:hypothetical protein HN011_003829 [Eciton burchellii]|nr:hypothetical protein HN011_003829 [Eciton burchellii]
MRTALDSQLVNSRRCGNRTGPQIGVNSIVSAENSLSTLFRQNRCGHEEKEGSPRVSPSPSDSSGSGLRKRRENARIGSTAGYPDTLPHLSRQEESASRLEQLEAGRVASERFSNGNRDKVRQRQCSVPSRIPLPLLAPRTSPLARREVHEVRSSLTRGVARELRVPVTSTSDAPLMPARQVRAITRASARDAKTF